MRKPRDLYGIVRWAHLDGKRGRERRLIAYCWYGTHGLRLFTINATIGRGDMRRLAAWITRAADWVEGGKR